MLESNLGSALSKLYVYLCPGRVDHKEREAMIEEDRMEFMWRGSDVLGMVEYILIKLFYRPFVDLGYSKIPYFIRLFTNRC